LVTVFNSITNKLFTYGNGAFSGCAVESFVQAIVACFVRMIVTMEYYGAPFVKILYLTDLAQKVLSLAEIAISACRGVISGRDSYLCMQRYR